MTKTGTFTLRQMSFVVTTVVGTSRTSECRRVARRRHRHRNKKTKQAANSRAVSGLQAFAKPSKNVLGKTKSVPGAGVPMEPALGLSLLGEYSPIRPILLFQCFLFGAFMTCSCVCRQPESEHVRLLVVHVLYALDDPRAFAKKVPEPTCH